MTFQSLRRLVQSARPPQPVRYLAATSLPIKHHDIQLSIGRSREQVVRGLRATTAQPVRMIIDRRVRGNPGPRTVHAVATRLAAERPITIGLPQSVSTVDLRRFEMLAAGAGAMIELAGSRGWARVEFGDRSRVLENADLPAEFYDGQMVVALSAPTGDGSIALWGDFAHPNTALRARVAPNATYDLALGIDASYLLVGQIGSFWMAAFVRSALTAELVAKGIERLRELQRGIEGPGPWEEPSVQHLAELDDHVAAATNLALRVQLENNAGEGLASRLGELLGWRVVPAAANGETSDS